MYQQFPEYSANNLPTIELEKRDEKIKITCVKGEGYSKYKKFSGYYDKISNRKGRNFNERYSDCGR